MMIVEIDSPTFPLITFIIRGKSRKIKVSQSPLELGRIAKTSILASANEIQENFLLFTKRFLIQKMLHCIVYSSFDVCVIR